MGVHANHDATGQHDLDQPLRRPGQRSCSIRGRYRRRRRQLNRGKLRRFNRRRSTKTQELMAPRLDLSGADPMLARHFRRRQLRSKAFGNNLPLLLDRP